MELTDPEIIYALHQGSLPAYEKVFTALYKPLHAYAFLLVKDRDLAEEAVQEVFCRVWQRREKISIQQSLQAYLYTAVHHECLRELKRRRVSALLPEHDNKAGSEEASAKLQQSQLEKSFLDALNRLPERCRLIFHLNRVEKLKYREVAERLGLSEKTVENQMGKALKLLRIYLSEFLILLIVVVCSLK